MPRLSGYVSLRFPGVMKMPMVTGIWPLPIRFSMTCGTRSEPFGFVARWPSWNTSTLAGFFGLYCAGT